MLVEVDDELTTDGLPDIRDPASAERFEQEAGDEYLRRREFLQRTAMTAGLAAGLGTVLDPETIVAEAARRQRRVRLPSPRNMPVDTFVVLMMENRSFDHYLGWLPHADGHQAGLSYTDRAGHRHPTHRLTPDYQGCAFHDPDHSWTGGREQLNGGKMDGFLRSGDNDEFAIGYYAEGDVGFIPPIARAFTTYDRFHCSLLGSTFPNREYMHAAQSYGVKDNSIPPEVGYNTGFPDNTIFAALSAKGISNRYFYVDEPVSILWGRPGMKRSSRVEEYYARCAAGTLPHLSFVDPAFAGEGQGTSGDEHPHGDVRTGQAYISDVVHAFLESPHWKSGKAAMFVVYDEWGGFFDHVRPPRVPDIRSDRRVDEDFGQMGFRIPAVAISPWVRRGHVSHSIYGFESILKMIEYKFGLKPLTRRDAYAQNIARSFDWRSKPQFTVPALPTPAHVVSQPCGSPAAGAAVSRPKPHDLDRLRSSGYLESLGFDYKPATPEAMFRQPSTIVDGLRRSTP